MSEIDGAENDFRARMSYGDYLRLPELLGAEAPLTHASASTRSGTLKPKALILLAIWRICLPLCWRVFFGLGFS